MFSIRLNKRTKTIKVVNRRKSIQLRHVRGTNIRLQHRSGARGPQGQPGQGLPAGGTQGQVPFKRSSEDFDIEWRQPSLADKTYSEYFTAESEIPVNHNLNKYPAVTVIDSAGDEVVGSIDHIDVNSLMVKFAYPTSGIISCN